MPSDKPDKVLKWRHGVSAVQTLSATAFAEKVIEHGLRVVGPYAGYLYCAQETDDGYDMFRMAAQTRYFWAFGQVCTQDNAAGGSLTVRVTAPAGAAFVPLAGRMAASGTRAAYFAIGNAGTAVLAYISVIGSAAGATAVIGPAPGSSTTSATNQEIHNKPIAYPSYLEGQVTTAAQTETATFVFMAELIGTSTAPTVSWATSGGTPNIAAATVNAVTSVVVT